MAKKAVFTPAQKISLVNQWMKSKKTMKEFCEQKGINANTFAGWVKLWHQKDEFLSSAPQISKKRAQKRTQKKLQAFYITDILDGDISFEIFAIGRGE